MRTRAGRGLRLLAVGLLALAYVAVPASRAMAQATAIDTTSDFAAVSWGPGRTDLFARGVDGTLEHKFYNGRWSQWQSLGGVVVGAPAATSWGAGRLDVFARGTDNAIHHISFSGGAWSGWESLGGSVTSAPAAASWGPNRIDVFVRGNSNALYHKYFTGSWTASWESLGGTLNSAPAVASWAANRLDVFAEASDKSLHHKWWNGTGWSGWEADGGTMTSAPSVAAWASGRLDVFYRGSLNTLQHKYWDGAWSGVQDLGGTMSTAPAASTDAANHLAVFYRNSATLSKKAWLPSWQAVQTIDETPGSVSPASYSPTVGLQGAPAAGATVGHLWFGYVDNVGRVVVGEQTDPDNVQSIVWTPLSGNEGFSGPPAVLPQPNGTMVVAAQHADSDVWTLMQSAGPPPAWGAWLSQGGSLASTPAPARMPDGSLALFSTDATGQLWALPQSGPNGAFGSWKALGGSGLVAGSLAAATVSGGVQVFGVTASGSVRTAEYYSSGTLSAWTELGGSGLAGTPAVVVYPGYLLRVFVRGADGLLVTKKTDGAGTWESAWSPVGSQPIVGSPAAVLSPTSGKTEVVARGADGAIYSTGETAQASGVWRDWTNVTLGVDVAATDPSIVTYTGSSGATWEFVFRNADQQNRIYTVSTGGSVAAAQAPRFSHATLPRAPVN
ncbi:MAG TPA: hypothetical protein VGJ07_01900 [Rugosimonospora sp.]